MLPRKYALTLEEVVGIILSLFIIVIIVALFVGCRKLRAKRHQNRNGGRNLLIQNEFDKEHIMMKQTRNGGHGAQPLEQDLPLLARPSSISPTVAAETNFNYMDTIRHYGAAAEELETLPRIPHLDYVHNLQKPVATVAPSVMADRDMNLKDNYFKRRRSPGAGWDQASSRPGSIMSGSGYCRPAPLSVALPPDPGLGAGPGSELGVEEDCQRYHWDCSDWAGQAAMLELPTAAPPSATPAWTDPGAGAEPGESGGVDPTRDIETLAEDDKEEGGEEEAASVASSECESQLGAVYPDTSSLASPVTSPMHQTNKSIEELLMTNDMNYADEDTGSADIPNIYDYKLHLNNYLPTYHLGSDPDTDEATPMLGRHPRPFPLGASSPEAPRYSAPGGGAAAQDPEAGARKAGAGAGPLRGLILPPVVTSSGQSTDKLCELEDEDEGEDNTAAVKRTPSPRVTRV